jgi:hypothetical protein
VLAAVEQVLRSAQASAVQAVMSGLRPPAAAA